MTDETTLDPIDPDAELLLDLIDALARRNLVPREMTVGRITVSVVQSAAPKTTTSTARSYGTRALEPR